MTDRELMQMALDALEMVADDVVSPYHDPIGDVILALRDRLAQPEHVHAIDISQERVDETAKREHEPWCDSVTKLLLSMPPQIPPCNCKPKREWVVLDDDIPGLGLVTEEFYNGMLCAEDILRKRNT